jgi:hypothetical protein
VSFELQVEFSGLCLFVVSTDRKRVGVAMPDAREKPNIATMRHVDNSVAVPHAGYLRFDLGDLQPGGVGIPRANGSNGPRYEVVHRFDRETLDLGLGREQSEVGVEELLFPSFQSIDDRLTILPNLFGDDAPPKELLMRTTLTGGTFTSHSGGSNWTFPTIPTGAGAPYQGQFANYAVWTRTINDESLTLTLAPFNKGEPTTLQLKPKNGVLRLKLANLCAENPLEWRELKLRTVSRDEDVDFKWLYRLMQDPEKVAPGPNNELPVPVLDRTSGVASADWDCTGGKSDGGI